MFVVFKTVKFKLVCYTVRDNYGLPRWLGGTEPACQAGDMSLIPG